MATKFRTLLGPPQRPLPQRYAPANDGGAIDHPRADEYRAYAAHMRFPAPFWEWLEREEAGESASLNAQQRRLQAAAAEPYCINPRRVRRFVAKRKASDKHGELL